MTASVAVLRQKHGDKGCIIAPSPSNPRCWRLTRFDSAGFSGHADYDTRDGALQDAIRSYQFMEPMSEREFTEMASTERFAAGNELTMFVSRVMLTPSEQRRVKDLNNILLQNPVR